MKNILRFILTLFLYLSITNVNAQDPNYILGPGDVIRISVFNNDDLLLETRIAEAGNITFPLIGAVKIGGNTFFCRCRA